jgi:Heterokaryon incompatibility protein (HET)
LTNKTVPNLVSKIPVWPDYEAISYVWGPQDPPHKLCINGETSGFIEIGKNLHDALQRLRPCSGQDARTLWVDQICINQTDLSERSAQVLRIGYIFRAARKVLVWLGQEDEYTALGFDFARNHYDTSMYNDSFAYFSLDVDSESYRQLSQKFETLVPKKYMDHHRVCYGNYEVDTGILEWCAATVRKLSYRGWFDRAWTYQELKLAKEAELICGSQSLPWIAFEQFLSFELSRVSPFYVPRQEGLELTKYLNWSRESYAFRTDYLVGRFSFDRLLTCRKASKCSDPRDKVIALLALADDMPHGHMFSGSKSASEFICPDYRMPVENLYLRTAYYIVQDSYSLGILTSVDTMATGEGLPSWVPDWRHFEEPASDSGTLHVVEEGFPQATRGSCHQMSLDGSTAEGTALRVSGIKQDCVSALSYYDENFVEEFFEFPNHTETYTPTMQPRNLAVMQTMMREDWSNTTHAAGAEFFGLHSSITTDEDNCCGSHTFEEQLASIDMRFSARDPDVQAFRGSKGFIGFGRRMQIGDEIFPLLGIDYPIVLRPVKGGYEFVGLCYAHGLMYGEGLHLDRGPVTCYYPGSSEADEFWPLFWPERKPRETEAGLSAEWLTIEAKERNPREYFKERPPDLLEDRFILRPDWEPPWTAPGEDSLWLLERGFNPVPILTEDVILV